jgi:hypothetical protein
MTYRSAMRSSVISGSIAAASGRTMVITAHGNIPPAPARAVRNFHRVVDHQAVRHHLATERHSLLDGRDRQKSAVGVSIVEKIRVKPGVSRIFSEDQNDFAFHCPA